MNNDLISRAVWTFVQTFIGTLSVALIALPRVSCGNPAQDVKVWLFTGVAAAIAALVSAVKTYVLGKVN